MVSFIRENVRSGIMVDRRGTEIKVGEVVAYNLSGEVAIGEVVSVKDGERNKWGTYIYSKRPIIKVKPDEPWTRLSSDGVSKVRNPYNLVVLL